MPLPGAPHPPFSFNSSVSLHAPSSGKLPWLPHMGFWSLGHPLLPDKIPLAMLVLIAEGVNAGEQVFATHHPVNTPVDSWEAKAFCRCLSPWAPGGNRADPLAMV